MGKVTVAIFIALLIGCSASSKEEKAAHEAVHTALGGKEVPEYRSTGLILGSRYLCGEANGQNAVGGYSGWQRYIVRLEDLKVIFAPTSNTDSTRRTRLSMEELCDLPNEVKEADILKQLEIAQKLIEDILGVTETKSSVEMAPD